MASVQSKTSVSRKYFGTDGIRGRANSETMCAEMALRLGMAAGHVLRRGAHRHRVLIGKDTRLSGYMIESAMTAGFTSMGMDVFLVGPLPTPAVAFLTRSLRADMGVMISASHNGCEDNGIKLFGADGYKLSDALESDIEHHMDNGLAAHLVAPKELGRAKRVSDAHARYIQFAKSCFTAPRSLDGVRVVLDCAHGAGYKVAAAALWELGAEVISVASEPDGFNINEQCGSMHPEHMCAEVRKHRADVGIALDGDADRVLIADASGRLIESDQILALIARHWQESGRLRGGGVVGSVMSNLGLERYLNGLGLALHRAPVGDRYLVAEMRERGVNLAGEPSGHIVLGDQATTGDGLLAALQFLSVRQEEEGARVSRTDGAARLFAPVPQMLRNVPIGRENPLGKDKVRAAIRAAEEKFAKRGRLVVRKSGTERLVRVMGESEDEGLMRDVVGRVASVIEQAAAAA